LYKTGKFAKWTDAIKEASKHLSHGKKVSGVKKVTKKKAVKKVTVKKSTPKSLHKDSKSHNVKISVMSGTKINDSAISEIKHINEMLHKWKTVLSTLEYDKKHAKDSLTKTLLRNDIKRVKNVLIDLKKNMSNLKKHIK